MSNLNKDWKCSGCLKNYPTGPNGYWQHLRQSRNPLCKAVLAELEKLPSSDSEAHDGSVADFSSDEEVQAGMDFDEALASDETVDLEPVLPGFDEPGLPQVVVEEEDPASGDELEPEEVSDTDQRMQELQMEQEWEPERVERTQAQAQDWGGVPEDATEEEARLEALIDEYRLAGQRADNNPLIVSYSSRHPRSKPGAVLRYDTPTDLKYRNHLNAPGNPWAPFKSEVDWKIAKWAKLRGAGSTAFSELLGIEGLQDALNLSYKTSHELNSIIDSSLPPRPPFKKHEVSVAGESFDLWARDIVECIKALWGDPEFLPFLVFEPERHYADQAHTVRMYHDMNTGNWWWSTQKKVEKYTKKRNITIVPIIISSDKTQLTTFRNKSAYPVYLTLGNIRKHVRRKPSQQAQILLAYLPTSKLEHITNRSARRRALANLFHACVHHILQPLEALGKSGLELVSGDGAVRDGHPIFAAFVGDYPEQLLAGGIKNGKCPTCDIHRKQIGDPALTGPPRAIEPILEAHEVLRYSDYSHFAKRCKEVGVKPIQHPFWERLPFVNIYRSITPDILHQMYQGNIKHLIGWIKQACGEDEIDARCRRLPPNHNIRLFLKGISHLSRVTGQEHDQICRFLLGLVADIKVPGLRSNARLVKATRAMLDFLFLAKYPVHTSETLKQLDDALRTYHDNRQVFIDVGVREHFNFPKDHFLNHYHELIELFGTADNFNTEYSERLHIDFAKNAYRSSNMKDEYPQMTAWLDRKERMLLHDKYVARQNSLRTIGSPGIRCSALPPAPPRQPPLVYPREIKMAAQPSSFGVHFDSLKKDYAASDFPGALARFMVRLKQPDLPKTQVPQESLLVLQRIPFHKVSVYHRIKFITRDPYSRTPASSVVVDSIHCEPSAQAKNGVTVPGRFDTALIDYQNKGRPGIRDCAVARVHFVFSLPANARGWFGEELFNTVPKHLAYVEWFTPFSTTRPGLNHRLYKVSPLKADGKAKASIVPVSMIRESVHLLPVFGPVAPAHWKSSNVLDEAQEFLVNPFSDRFQYSTLM